MSTPSSPVPQSPIGPYWYENLGEDEFQKLCHVLIASKFDRVTCYPVGQKDGGRDISQKTDTGSVVYQVKWSKVAVKNPVTWLEKAVEGESKKIKARVREGATRYVLMTSVSGTAAAATGPNAYGAGTIDKLELKLAAFAAEYKLETMDCWWRDDIDALIPTLSHSVLWRFQRMLAGPEAMRFLLDAEQSELVDARIALLVRKAVGAQWSQDAKVKFKQAELDNDDLEDLFIDVRAQTTESPRSVSNPYGTRSAQIPAPLGAVEYLVKSPQPFTLVRGEPGQGKSTLGQYLSQIYRSEFVPDDPGVALKRPTLTPTASRMPLRIDLRDYGTWLDGYDPFDESKPTPTKAAKSRRLGSVEKFLAIFLTSLTASSDVTQSTIDDLLTRFPVLVVFDGLDEVAQRTTRKRVVDEIEKFIGRWRASSVPPKIVVTTRPNVSKLAEPSSQWFETITLIKLDHELRTEYLRKWCAARGIVNRARRELMHTFDTRTAEPHIAQLAENPMQLTILLYLLHLQGHSVPDKRTPLYDDYMKTFLNREAEKSASVRDNRENLEEVTAYLGWYLQGLAEENGSIGRLTTTALKTEIYRYLTTAEKDAALVEALFTSVTDRVWALSSKSQGTFQFDVQPVQEFFAAKYLSQYAAVDKSDVLNELIRRPFWFNTSRFFAGFAHANEVGGLVDGLVEEFAEARHPLAERVAAWTLLADGVFSSKTTAQRRAVDLLTDDLSIRLLLASNASAKPLPVMPADRGADRLHAQLLDSVLQVPEQPISMERIALAAGLGIDAARLEQWWLVQARPGIGGADESTWLRLGIPIAAGRLLQPADLDRLALSKPRTIAAAIAAGVVPTAGSDLEARLVNAVLAGHCSDVAAPQGGLASDLVNTLAPREFLRLAQDEESTVLFARRSGHCGTSLRTLKRQDAFRRLKNVNAGFDKVQRSMNKVRLSPNSVAPWSDAAEQLRGIYGPTWLALDIAVIGAAIDPKVRRDVGPMNPARSTFGPNIDYGRLVNDVRINRARAEWWIEQRENLTVLELGTWGYALVAVAAPHVLDACMDLLAADLAALPTENLEALMSSSSRLGLSGVSRRLTTELFDRAARTSLSAGLLISHHVDQLDASAFSPESATQAARYGVAAWPALHVAGLSLAQTESEDWLAALKAHGPVDIAAVRESLSDVLCSRILADCAHYPLELVLGAASARAQRNTEAPLRAVAGTWFDD